MKYQPELTLMGQCVVNIRRISLFDPSNLYKLTLGTQRKFTYTCRVHIMLVVVCY